MNLSKRSAAKELLDEDDIPFEHIRQNMQELNTINAWLGGHAITLNGLKQLIGKRKTITVCEIGCGGGDNLFAINNWCRRNQISATLIGIDIKKECIDFAQQQHKNFQWMVSDYKHANLSIKPDIIFSSLFCHHFSDDELVEQLKWMQQNASLGFFINDLHRHAVAYWSIKLLTAVFSSSYLVKHDAPLSVARGFKSHEWELLIEKAAIANATVNWKWAFRHLIVYKK